MSADTEAFLTCLAHADRQDQPYPHWHLAGMLSEETVDGLLALPFGAQEVEIRDGRRESANDTRSYLNPDLCAQSPASASVVATFQDPQTRRALEATCDVDLSDGLLRIEYTRDSDGFWLEPHTDIGVKMFTMLVYLSREPELEDAGTDVFDADHNHVGRAPFKPNHGLIFIPGENTWHGFVKRPIHGVRRSLIVNYVKPEWRERWQLA